MGLVSVDSGMDKVGGGGPVSSEDPDRKREQPVGSWQCAGSSRSRRNRCGLEQSEPEGEAGAGVGELLVVVPIDPVATGESGEHRWVLSRVGTWLHFQVKGSETWGRGENSQGD